MCEIYDDGERSIVHRITPVQRAYKDYACEDCDLGILAGWPYVKEVALFEGVWSTWRWCQPCQDIREAFDKKHRRWVPPGELRSLLKDCVDDGGREWLPILRSLEDRTRKARDE